MARLSKMVFQMKKLRNREVNDFTMIKQPVGNIVTTMF